MSWGGKRPWVFQITALESRECKTATSSMVEGLGTPGHSHQVVIQCGHYLALTRIISLNISLPKTAKHWFSACASRFCFVFPHFRWWLGKQEFRIDLLVLTPVKGYMHMGCISRCFQLPGRHRWQYAALLPVACQNLWEAKIHSGWMLY